MGDLVRRDTMDLDIARIKDHERRSDEGITFFDTAAVIHSDRSQGAGTVGVFIGRFKVDGRKIEHNLPSFLTNERILFTIATNFISARYSHDERTTPVHGPGPDLPGHPGPQESEKHQSPRPQRRQAVPVGTGPCPLAYIEDFLEKKTDFIIRAICEMEERKQKFPILTLSDGDTLYLAGQPYRLDVRLGLHNSIRRSGQTVFMELADDTPVMRQKLYHKLLQALGKKLFPASLSRMQPLFAGLALPDPVLKQRVMRSRWGSCMPLKGIVTMNTYLAIMPEAIIDHVMLHELCHFLQPNHSRHFYDAMTIRMPDWKARRQAMAKYLPYCV